MKTKLTILVMVFALFGSIADGGKQTPHPFGPTEDFQTVTLYSPRQRHKDERHDLSKACFSFRLGAYSECGSRDTDLLYGLFIINDYDWFKLSDANDTRTVIKDLGEFNPKKPFKIPKLDPLPQLKPGQKRKIVVDGSGDGFEDWTRTTQIFAPVWTGHIYVMHVKETESDFYVLFHVEDFAEDQYCKINWKRIPEPEKKSK